MILSSFLLTEHRLQPHQTSHKVVEVDGHAGVGVSGYQQLVDGVVEGEACRGSYTPNHQHCADANIKKVSMKNLTNTKQKKQNDNQSVDVRGAAANSANSTNGANKPPAGSNHPSASAY